MTLHISFDEILERVYSQSAWHVRCRPGLRALTADNERLVVRGVERAYHALCSRTAGYLRRSTLNRQHTTDNITLQYDLYNTKPYCGDDALEASAAAQRSELLESTLRGEVVELLAATVLADHYGSDVPYFDIARRRHLAGLLLLLAHPARVGG